MIENRKNLTDITQGDLDLFELELEAPNKLTRINNQSRALLDLVQKYIDDKEGAIEKLNPYFEKFLPLKSNYCADCLGLTEVQPEEDFVNEKTCDVYLMDTDFCSSCGSCKDVVNPLLYTQAKLNGLNSKDETNRFSQDRIFYDTATPNRIWKTINTNVGPYHSNPIHSPYHMLDAAESYEMHGNERFLEKELKTSSSSGDKMRFLNGALMLIMIIVFGISLLNYTMDDNARIITKYNMMAITTIISSAIAMFYITKDSCSKTNY